METILGQPAKTPNPMYVIWFGIITEERAVQPLNAKMSICVTLLGKEIEFKAELPSKARSSILVTPSGITVLEQPRISSPDAVLIIALQLSRESYTRLPSDTTMESKLEQREKEANPIFITLLGITIEVRDEQ